ncbi:hypothetical protein [Marinomonas balearica]|uniref:Uncharacterized protein n=1 Tax=Marinomonas balearica TaxID=491947 RepID=A0A4V3CGM1_9GAMM|nr:hypothetical protein [Marinomonas balearica]TDO98292.1 hypothetical protein DFP79_1933 [Marinomonas balearica]
MTVFSPTYVSVSLHTIQDIEEVLFSYAMNPVFCLQKIRSVLSRLFEQELIGGTTASVLFRFTYRYVTAEIEKGSRYSPNVVSNLFGQMDGVRTVIAASSFGQSDSALKRLSGLPFWSNTLLVSTNREKASFSAKLEGGIEQLIEVLPALVSLGSLRLDVEDDVYLMLETTQPLSWLSTRFSHFEWFSRKNDLMDHSSKACFQEGLRSFLRDSPNVTLVRQGQLSKYELRRLESSLQGVVSRQYVKASDCRFNDNCLTPDYLVPIFEMEERELAEDEVCDFLTVSGHSCMYLKSDSKWTPELLGRQSCVVEVVIVEIGDHQFAFPKTSLSNASDEQAIYELSFSNSDGWHVREAHGTLSNNHRLNAIKLKVFDKIVWVNCDHFWADFAISYDVQSISNLYLNIWSTDHYGILVEPNFISLIFNQDELNLPDFALVESSKSVRNSEVLMSKGVLEMDKRVYEIKRGQYISSPSEAVVDVVSAHALSMFKDSARWFDQLIPLVNVLGNTEKQSDLVVIFRNQGGFLYGIRVLNEVHTEEVQPTITLKCELLYDNGYQMKLGALSDFTYFDWEAISNMAQNLIHMMSEDCLKNGC